MSKMPILLSGAVTPTELSETDLLNMLDVVLKGGSLGFSGTAKLLGHIAYLESEVKGKEDAIEIHEGNYSMLNGRVDANDKEISRLRAQIRSNRKSMIKITLQSMTLKEHWPLATDIEHNSFKDWVLPKSTRSGFYYPPGMSEKSAEEYYEKLTKLQDSWDEKTEIVKKVAEEAGWKLIDPEGVFDHSSSKGEADEE